MPAFLFFFGLQTSHSSLRSEKLSKIFRIPLFCCFFHSTYSPWHHISEIPDEHELGNATTLPCSQAHYAVFSVSSWSHNFLLSEFTLDEGWQGEHLSSENLLSFLGAYCLLCKTLNMLLNILTFPVCQALCCALLNSHYVTALLSFDDTCSKSQNWYKNWGWISYPSYSWSTLLVAMKCYRSWFRYVTF